MPMAQPVKPKGPRLSPLTRQVVLYVVCLLPGALEIAQGMAGALGPNPIAECVHAFGLDAFRFLLLSLVVTPLRNFAGVNLILYRRPLGLVAFTYAAVHVLFYVGAMRHFDGHILWRDFTSRPFLIFGFLAFLILLVLALTSTRRAIRALGRRWVPLHRFVYLATFLASVHYSLAFKTWHSEAFIYAVLATALLAMRLVKKPSGKKVI